MRTQPAETTARDDHGTAAASGQLTIGQLARLTDMSAKVIRYYEDIGLLPRPPRAANGYRRYGVADINRLHLLRRIRFLDIPLSVARPLLAGANDARCADVRNDLLTLVHQRVRALDQEIAELHQLRAEVEGFQRALAACSPDATNQTFSACTDMRCIALPSHDHQNEEGTHASF
ncbi:MAG: MerR family DNA-binding transcriptional regulator [Ktedonobacterales bacterium]|nr:MerR family DNA-binding transcriptional regulator [Ktedonobacterales bacterium]